MCKKVFSTIGNVLLGILLTVVILAVLARFLWCNWPWMLLLGFIIVGCISRGGSGDRYQ